MKVCQYLSSLKQIYDFWSKIPINNAGPLGDRIKFVVQEYQNPLLDHIVEF